MEPTESDQFDQDFERVKNFDSQYLTFMLMNELYGVDILRVQEIKGWSPVTNIPNTLPYIKGVINLRGTIVPVLDLRMRFDLESAPYDQFTVVIVLSIKSKHKKERIIGIVVDTVSDVFDVDSNEIKPTPNFGSSMKYEFISGLTSNEEKNVLIIDIDKLLTDEELLDSDNIH